MSDPAGSKVFCIVCGAGETGLAVARELAGHGFRVTIVDHDADILESVSTELPGVGTVEGNCLSDVVLKQAGLSDAEALFAVLPDDRSNVFLSLSAGRIKPELKIYSIASDTSAARKLRLVGVRRTINPNTAEGLRMSNELIRPNVAAFLNRLVYAADQGEDGIRYLSVPIPDSVAPGGTTLGALRVTELTGVVVVAVGRKNGDMVYSPSADVRVGSGDQLIAFGTSGDGDKVRGLIEKSHAETRGRRGIRRLLRRP